jgi:hypothetical protein
MMNSFLTKSDSINYSLTDSQTITFFEKLSDKIDNISRKSDQKLG